MKEALQSKGWVMFYECVMPCAKQQYNHPDKPGYEIRVKPKRQTFSILYQNNIVAGPFWGYQLEEKLLQYGI
jgi:hypothetical protein